ncbi:MAG: alpha/beta hydrolase-fold protein [Acidobacteriota bacterium]
MSTARPIRFAIAVISFFAAGSVFAAQLVSYSLPADRDRVTFRVPITLHFASPLEVDANGDGRYTRVDSASIDAVDPDVAVIVRLERDADDDPATPGGVSIPATATWEVADYPPLLRIVPQSTLERNAWYRVIGFQTAGVVRRASDGAPADPFEVTFRTLPAGGTGTVSRKTFTPPSLGYTEDYNLYLPPGHGASPTQKYPAIYLLHGGFGDWSSWNSGGVVQQIVDRLVDAGAIEPVIVAMPDGNGGPACFGIIPFHRLWSNSYNGQWRYGDYASLDLPNDVEARFGAANDRRRRGVAGMSMGGFGAASVGLGHPSRFSLVAPLAGWQWSVRMTSSPHRPVCDAAHWPVVPNFGSDCFGLMLQSAVGPAALSDLTHTKSINGRDLAEVTADTTFRGAIFIAHGAGDTTATVEWSDDVSCALDGRATAHCYKRPPGVGHDGNLWNVALENDVLPRFNVVANWATLPAGINNECVNATVLSPRDADLDGLADTLDNCRDEPNLAQLDTDLDGRGDACDLDDDNDLVADPVDCAPLDRAAGRPGSITGVRLDGVQLAWDVAPSADTYDLSRGLLSALPATGACLARGIAQPSFDDPATPPAANGFLYLVRGVDAGCGGSGVWGDGEIPSCP